MNNFLSKVVAASLLSSIAITSANAFDDRITPNAPVWGTSLQQQGGELLGANVELNVTLNANSASDTHFTLNFNNGSIADTGAYSLCNGAFQAGTYLAPEALNADGRLTAVVMEFKPANGDTSLIAAGSVLNFISGTDCNATTTVEILPDTEKCVSVFSNHGENTSGTVFIPDINSKESDIILKYKAEIQISCTAPVCGIDATGTQFVSEGTVADVNKRVANPTVFSRDTTGYDCYAGGCDEIDNSTTCTTTITLLNNTDRNITKLSITPTFDGTLPAGMTVQADVNGTVTTVTSGTKFLVDLASDNIEPDENQTITLIFDTDGSAIIPEGTLNGVISNVETNVSTDTDKLASTSLVAKDGLAKFSKGSPSEFTVTYMNPSKKSFAMITATAGDTALTAVIIDSEGKVAEADLGILAAGKTKFVWADNGHPNDPLYVAAKANGLNDAWRVNFKVTDAVDVAAYMEAGTGQRTLTVLYPEYATNN